MRLLYIKRAKEGRENRLAKLRATGEENPSESKQPTEDEAQPDTKKTDDPQQPDKIEVVDWQEVTSNDVLLSKGDPVPNEGNIRFHKLIEDKTPSYLEANRDVRDNIVSSVIDTIKKRGGRILRPMESKAEAERLGVPQGSWLVIDPATESRITDRALQEYSEQWRAAGGNSINFFEQLEVKRRLEKEQQEIREERRRITEERLLIKNEESTNDDNADDPAESPNHRKREREELEDDDENAKGKKSSARPRKEYEQPENVMSLGRQQIQPTTSDTSSSTQGPSVSRRPSTALSQDNSCSDPSAEPLSKYLGLPKDQWESSTPHVTEVTDNDVILGRGVRVTNSKGNERFQKLLKNIHATYYNSTKNVKDAIVRSLYKKTADMGGKFLKPIESAVELTLLGVQTGPAWAIVDEATSLDKIKQSIREYHLKEKAASYAASDDNDSEVEIIEVVPAPARKKTSKSKSLSGGNDNVIPPPVVSNTDIRPPTAEAEHGHSQNTSGAVKEEVDLD